MPDTYSTYEAKSRFSEIIRRVRAGRRVIISYRGQPVAEIGPIAAPPKSLAESLALLEREGTVVGPSAGRWRPASVLRAGARRPGALGRFLRSRN